MLEFRLPEVGENITAGNVVNITVSVGDRVQKDQTLLELETDKASLEVPAPCDGVIKEILIKEGQEVQIGSVIMTIDPAGATAEETAAEPSAPASAPAAKAKPAPAETPSQDAPATAPAPQTAGPQPAAAIPPQTDVPAAPSVRRFARELGIEIAKVPGSGPGGRVSKDDVKAYAKKLLTAPASSAAVPAAVLPDFSQWGQVERQPMNNIRKKTAQHMHLCWSTIPHVTQFDKADITDLERLRKKYSTKDRKLTITPFLLKVMAAALKKFPMFNASLDMTTQEVVYKKYIHIGVAVDTERGLLVPVLRDVDQKSVIQLAEELNATAERARAKKITLEELQGGSMTLTNLGGIGGTHFTPIVNWPEVAILGVSRGGWEPVFDDGKFVPRFRLPLSLSYDHRLIDGADGARFLRWVCAALEQPFLMELS